MQPNMISDVESVIRIALFLEKFERQRSSNTSSQPMSNRSNITENQKPISNQNFPQNPPTNPMKNNSSISFMSTTKASKYDPFDASRDSEMAV